MQYFPIGPDFPVDRCCRSQSLGTFIILISVPVDSLSVGCWQDAATTGYRRTLDIFNGRSRTTCSPVDRPVDVYFDRLLKVATTSKKLLDASFHPGIKSPPFLTIRLHFHTTEAHTRAFSTPPLESFSGMPPIGFSLSAPAFLEFSRRYQLAVYAGAIYIAPPADTRHWFDQPILALYDDYVLDVQAFVIGTTTNQSLS